jgi:type I restriction enzyme S subunit
MSFPAYPVYKESGVEWLGDVPEHWKISPLKFSASCNDSVLPDSTDDDYEIEYVEISDVNEMSGITGSTSYKFADAPSRARRMLQNGDVLVSTVRTYLRAIAPVVAPPENLIASTGFAVVRPRKGILDGAFLGYLLRAEWWISEVIARSVGVSYPAINASDLIGLNVPVPAWHEQTQIARFLDHETARIDALIEEQQRLIELLKEKRQAVISHAVTKGLDPTLPMKESGVEWLGEVPAHWDVVPTNYRYEIQLGRMLNEQRAQGEHLKPYLRVFDVQWHSINTADLPMMDFPPDAQSMYRLRDGDLLVNEGGSYVGRSAIWRGELDECYYQKALHRLRPHSRKNDTSEFFLYVMEMATQLGVFVAGGNQTTIDHLTAEQLRKYRFAFPPLEEQQQIAEFLSAASSENLSTTAEAEKLIGFLQERRSALISAAVTGKIDVRGWQPPASTQAPEPVVAEAV